MAVREYLAKMVYLDQSSRPSAVRAKSFAGRA